jgi:hypothetical protein
MLQHSGIWTEWREMLSVTIILSVSASRLHKFTLINSPSTAHMCRGIVFDCDRQTDLLVTDIPPS